MENKMENIIQLNNKQIKEKITIHILVNTNSNLNYSYEITRNNGKKYHCNNSSRLLKFIGDMENKLHFEEAVTK